jgi:hypothetical protein
MGERRTLKHQTAFARLLDHCGAADADWRQRAIQDHPLLGRMGLSSGTGPTPLA